MRRYILDINLIKSLESTKNLLTYRPSEDDNVTMEDFTPSPFIIEHATRFPHKGLFIICFAVFLF
ncbi:hypothetical protein NC653_009300 [Populus alba x Populus x berolinensis]|uniref:Uncharacterized protein n=1 Tax=Populus alba x Populus x berolinensis TaxID=444605 RepID=A0AAD6R8K8_9ROSI|nr:hypothetical protein NC653_009300 [Populus alba x Populus x berolinensis]